MNENFPLYLIPLLPLLGAAFNLLVGRKLNRLAVYTVACGSVLGAFGVVAYAAVAHLLPLWKAAHAAAGDSLMATPALLNTAFEWIPAGKVSIKMGMIMDPLSAVMVFTVTFVGFLIHLYSTGYMSHEKDYARFFGYLNLFTGAMLLLVLGDNLLVLFVGWEGVGVCSYLLIGFWYNKSGTKDPGDENASAGRKAFIVNRVGDLAFILGMFLIFSTAGTLNVQELQANADKLLLQWNPLGNAGWLNILPGVGSLACGDLSGFLMIGIVIIGAVLVRKLEQWAELIGWAVILVGWGWSIFAGFSTVYAGTFTVAGVAAVLMLVGACGKSAQIPLYVWLPDAMAGPTPVSALIHAATMVTAGVYMVARLNFMFMMSPVAMGLVALVGACTALYAATIGFAQNDIKKVLAYSTISQLGYMFIGVGVGAFAAGVFHLFTHAFFKACLFLGAGAVIHAMSGKQDIREMGGLRKLMPLTHGTFLISCIAIAGIPPFAGFFSKDEILWKAITTGNPGWPAWFPMLIYVLGMAGAVCTAFYMFRLYYLTFGGENRADEHTRHHIHEQPWNMTVPLIVLAFGAAVLGFLGLPGVLGEHANVFHNWLAPVVDRGAAMTAAAGFDSVRPNVMAANHGLEWGLMGLSVTIAIIGILIARGWYRQGPSAKVEVMMGKAPRAHQLVMDKYRIDELYFTLIVWPLRWFSMALWKGIDAFFIDMVGVNGSGWVVKTVGRFAARLQNGSLQRYIVGLVVGIAALTFFLTMAPDNFVIKAAGAKIKAGEQVTFDATRLTTVDKRDLEYRWDFTGDGKPDTQWSKGTLVQHKFDKAGKYRVTLFVRDNRWRTSATEIKTVEVQ